VDFRGLLLRGGREKEGRGLKGGDGREGRGRGGSGGRKGGGCPFFSLSRPVNPYGCKRNGIQIHYVG